MKRWACMEAGCSFTVTAVDEDDLLEKANAHVGAEHDSYELEDVILADAEEVPDGG